MNILITGGANGLGEAMTRLLAHDIKNKVYFTFSKSNLKAIEIENEFFNTKSIKCDFKNSSDIISLKDSLKLIDIDILINNAYCGDIQQTHFHKTKPHEFLNNFKENIIPVIEITQEAISIFRKKKFGKIITILTSYLVNVPPSGLSVYVANKAYLEKLTKVWATENAKFNISSNSVSPSFMLTNLNLKIDERIIEQIEKNNPLKKLLSVEEVAESVQYLVNASSQINGIDILINSASNIK